MKKKLYSMIYYGAMLLALGSLGYISFHYYELYQSNQQIAKIQDLVKVTTPIHGDEKNPNGDLRIDFSVLKKINPDAIGWIAIDHSTIDYPVVKGSNNEYYLTHNIFKKYDRQGAVFMDHQNTMSDYNVILYAHNMKNGTMFADVSQYKKTTYLKDHPIISLDLDGSMMNYEVIAAFYYHTTRDTFNYIQRNFTSGERKEYQRFINQRTLYGQENMNAEDQLLTLSTCNYDDKGDRFVVVARKIK